jgi:micrococcal nuclease
VLPSGVTYNAYLVQEGLARVYDSADFELMDAYLAYQHEAQQEGAGVWSQADYAEKDGVCIDTINPFSETVTITNYGDSSVNMSSWSLHDEAQKTYVFPAGFVIQAGASVTIHSEDGINTPQSLYWDSDSNVWNNDSDSATLVDGNGDVVDVFTY